MSRFPAHFAASHLRLFCLSMSHKKDARLIWVNNMGLLARYMSFLFRDTYYSKEKQHKRKEDTAEKEKSELSY